jgi:hypothetical protein
MSEKRTIQYVDGKPVIQVVKTVTENVEIPGWLSNATDHYELLRGLDSIGIPHTFKTPGTPSRGKALDRYRLTVFGTKTIKVESLSSTGLAKQAHSLLAGVEVPPVTIQKSIKEEVAPGPSLDNAGDVLAAASAEEEEELAEIKRLEQMAEGEVEELNSEALRIYSVDMDEHLDSIQQLATDENGDLQILSEVEEFEGQYVGVDGLGTRSLPGLDVDGEF